MDPVITSGVVKDIFVNAGQLAKVRTAQQRQVRILERICTQESEIFFDFT